MNIIFLGDELEINVDSDCEREFTFLERLSKYLENKNFSNRFDIYIRPENFHRYIKIFTDSGIVVKIDADNFKDIIPVDVEKLNFDPTFNRKSNTYTYEDEFSLTFKFKINIFIQQHHFHNPPQIFLRLAISKTFD